MEQINEVDASDYEAPQLTSLGSIQEWTLSGGSNTIGISIILP